jgi:hypothetical protein
MKTLLIAILALSCLALNAATYPDSTGATEGSIVAGQPHIDISSVDLTQNGSELTFKINLAGSPVTTDWGKYLIAIDSKTGGDVAGNGWGRPISMSSGMDYFVGAWADSGNGAEIRTWGGSAWALQSATYGANPDVLNVAKDAGSFTIRFNYTGLGLTPGSAFTFDVLTTGGGGGDSAIDALSDADQAAPDWGVAYNSLSTLTYTVVPEPSALALLGLGAAALLLRRKSS